MKTVILALLVLVVVSQGEALRCRCKGSTSCEQTCRGTNQVCGSIVKTAGYQVYSYQSCMDAFACDMLSEGASYAICCSQSLCNT